MTQVGKVQRASTQPMLMSKERRKPHLVLYAVQHAREIDVALLPGLPWPGREALALAPEQVSSRVAPRLLVKPPGGEKRVNRPWVLLAATTLYSWSTECTVAV